jgi:hypothetical protein
MKRRDFHCVDEQAFMVEWHAGVTILQWLNILEIIFCNGGEKFWR